MKATKKTKIDELLRRGQTMQFPYNTHEETDRVMTSLYGLSHTKQTIRTRCVSITMNYLYLRPITELMLWLLLAKNKGRGLY